MGRHKSPQLRPSHELEEICLTKHSYGHYIYEADDLGSS